MDLGSTIKYLRIQKGFNQREFAETCSITPSYLSQIEKNQKEPNLGTLKVICTKLGMPLPFLFFLAMDVHDVQSEKREVYNLIQPALKELIQNLMSEDGKKA